MSVNSIGYVDGTLELTQDFWAPLIEKEMRENTLWVGLLQDPNYTLTKIKGGDTYKITTINKPTSTIRTIGTDADSFSTNVLTSSQVDLKVDKRCVSAIEIEDLAELQSQLGNPEGKSQIREAMLADVREQANDWVKSLISPSTSDPDHVITSSDFNIAQLSAVRTLAARAKWQSSGEPWYLLLDPTYYSDCLDDTAAGGLANSESMGIGASPVIGSQFRANRMNFNIVEDDSLETDVGYAFVPSFMKIIVGEPRFMLSNLHAQKKFGYVLSVDFPLGAIQNNDERVISIKAS